MEVNDWTPSGKESFTTPGGPFRRPTGGSDKTYSYARPQAAAPDISVRPAPQGAQSPFSREAGTARPWYENVEPLTQASASVISHDGETAGVTPPVSAPGAPQVYTIQLPAAPRQPAKRKRSLWWVPLLLIAALLLGVALGALGYPLLRNRKEPQQTEPTANTESSVSRVYRENVDTVVGITALPNSDPASGTNFASAGTGFLISVDGYILTSGHVVGTAETILVGLSDGRQFHARLVNAENETSDLALLKIDAEGLHAVAVGNSDAVAVGDRVCTIGNPLGDLTYSLTAGYLSAGARQIRTGSVTLTMLQTNAAINKGNSGGPLFDESGRVIGIVTAKYSASDEESTVEGLGFALPINAVMELAQAWITADRGS